MSEYHVTAMLEPAVEILGCRPGKIIVDGTLGGAGHARRICEQIAPNGVFIGIDQDADAIARCRNVLWPSSVTVHVIHGNFVDLPSFLDRLGIEAVDGILIDIGLSLHQIEASGRGFSFLRDEPLDMRMDVRSTVTAKDLLASLEEDALAKLFERFGEERWAGRIARKIVQQRTVAPIATSGQLAELISAAVPAGAARKQKIHPATRVFMALRIAVNRELAVLDEFLTNAVHRLKSGGRLCVLSFHSLEDRIVKHRFREMEQPCVCPPDFPQCVCGRTALVRRITRKVVRPTNEEIQENPMARSTRMRAVEKL